MDYWEEIAPITKEQWEYLEQLLRKRESWEGTRKPDAFPGLSHLVKGRAMNYMSYEDMINKIEELERQVALDKNEYLPQDHEDILNELEQQIEREREKVREMNRSQETDALPQTKPASKLASPAEQAGLASKLAWITTEGEAKQVDDYWREQEEKSKALSQAALSANMQESQIENMILGVSESLNNAKVYANVERDLSTFKVEFIAVARLADGAFVATHKTSSISRGATSMQLNREIQIAKDALVLELANRVFVSDLTPIENALIKTFVEPDYKGAE